LTFCREFGYVRATRVVLGEFAGLQDPGVVCFDLGVANRITRGVRVGLCSIQVMGGNVFRTMNPGPFRLRVVGRPCHRAGAGT
jgi:hypothetical protein